MGLSRNKVAVPEGAAGTPPFWSDFRNEKVRSRASGSSGFLVQAFVYKYREKGKLDASSAGPEDGSLSGSTPRFSLCLGDANPLANDL